MTGRFRVCADNFGAKYSTAAHVVKELVITDRRQDLRTLNYVMMDAYLYDNVDYFYVVYNGIKPNETDCLDSSSVFSVRYFRQNSDYYATF